MRHGCSSGGEKGRHIPSRDGPGRKVWDKKVCSVFREGHEMCLKCGMGRREGCRMEIIGQGFLCHSRELGFVLRLMGSLAGFKAGEPCGQVWVLERSLWKQGWRMDKRKRKETTD